ncbi:MAG: dihydroxyacetone kinase operon transcriptional regulator DhaR [Candidatus Promineifilaceae bacterium]|nr:dihydroxyacetone kinase operon transcriptional regulator DhaR [Candidatus Promineifilaceae bacterium]
MQPVAYPVDPQALEQAWRSYVEQGELAPTVAATFDPAVLQSWRRCALRLDPRARPRPIKAGEQALESLVRAQSNLITVATPLMEDIHQFSEGSECAIMLADGTACVLALLGDLAALDQLQAAGLGYGTYWSEGQLGTNAFALALDAAMPVQVVGAEHYYQAYHHWVTTAAPVHDVRGRIIGLLGVVGPAAQATAHTASLVMAATRAISNQLFTDWYLDEANVRLSEVNTILGAIAEGVIAWDDSGRIHHTNKQAGQILGLDSAAIVGRQLEESVPLPPALAKAVANATELRDVETTFQQEGRAVNCLSSLRFVPEGTSSPRVYVLTLRPIEQVRQLVQQQIGARATLTLDDLTSQSSVMRRVLRQARVAARGQAPVLLRGEGGAGKNHLARAIHNDSSRADKPFLAIDCRAIPHELMAGEFLGQEKGTGILGRPSKFELVHGGTLLLDQIETLSLEAQTALLRVMETGHVMRLGGSRPIPLDVRVMAATTANLEALVAEGGFISHLYYRFAVFDIAIPPLRERIGDIPLLAERFLARISRRDDRPYWIDSEAVAVLERYPWPGNVREMESVLERAVSQARDGVLRLVDLPDFVRRGRVLTGDSPQPAPVLSVAEAEREAIIRAGRACEGRVTEMARQLGIGRTTLWRKMKRLGLSATDFK